MRYVPAIYPSDAERTGVEGMVLLEAVISVEGQPIRVTTANSLVDERLEAAATEAVTQWRYEPALQSGQPIELAVTISVAFQIP